MVKASYAEADRLAAGGFTGARLKQALAELGWTQRQFAEHIGEDYYQVNRWCNNHPDSQIPKLVKLYVPCLLALNGVKV